MADARPQVYFSYKWGGESERIVDQIAAALTEAGIAFVRDKVDLGYKGRISEFMKEIGRGGAVVVVICDRYLRSPNTMFELVQIGKSRDVHDRIFPVVLSDAGIYDAVLRLGYVKFWEDKKRALSDAMRGVDLANLQGITDDLNLYDEIRDEIAGLTALLKDMNTLTPQMHQDSNFASLIDSLRQRLGVPSQAARAPKPEPVPQVALDLARDLETMMRDAQAEGLMVHLTTAEDRIDLACVATCVDGSLRCALASDGQLPSKLRTSAGARLALVAEHGFTAPGAEGGEFTLQTEPANREVVAAFARQLAGALMMVYRVDADRLGWRLLPD